MAEISYSEHFNLKLTICLHSFVPVAVIVAALANPVKQTFPSAETVVCHTKLWYKRFAKTYPRGTFIMLNNSFLVFFLSL